MLPPCQPARTPLLPLASAAGRHPQGRQIAAGPPPPEPGSGHWGLPGGKWTHADAADATTREIAEELGITIALTRLLVVDQIDRPAPRTGSPPSSLATIQAGTPPFRNLTLVDWGWFLLKALPLPADRGDTTGCWRR
jgi:8-oxo-dGTP pyrophosphatase MutT (NUDIX family)